MSTEVIGVDLPLWAQILVAALVFAGLVLLVGGLLFVAVIKLIMDRNWIGLLLCVVALFLVFGAGHHTK